jgi:Protein of unknown function (DUF2752)
MLYSLMHGNLPAAATYNALGLTAVLLVWAYAAWTYRRLRAGNTIAVCGGDAVVGVGLVYGA